MKESKLVRMTLNQKNRNNKNYFKEKARNIKGMSFTNHTYNSNLSEYKRKKINYDLMNNIIDVRDFSGTHSPYGAEMGELPATFSNKDIISARIKKLIGMEMKRTFSHKIIATNKEATTRKEETEFGLIREYVNSMIMTPIQQQVEMKYQEQLKGELSNEDRAQIMQQIEQELASKTPPEVKTYMQREHQDPAEAQANQLINYLSKKQDLKDKFNKGWIHAMAVGEEAYWVGETRGHPSATTVNMLRFDYDKSPDMDFIEDGEWACAEYKLTPSQIVRISDGELKPGELDRIYSDAAHGAKIYDEFFTFEDSSSNKSDNTLSVYHIVWKDLRRIGFLSYINPMTGQIEETQVGEAYKLNKEQGDISVKWEWIPETYETYMVFDDIFFGMRPVRGQFKDLNDLFKCKLPYYGAAYDNLNSEITSPIDRMKHWQYYYNIVLYRVELLMASDKGKILLMNIKGIPRSSGIKMDQWLYYMDALNIGWVNPDEEGNRGVDVTNMAKEVDMSLASDIQKYIDLAEYINLQCGKSIGLSDDMLGQISPSTAVANTKVNLESTSDILEPYFNLHNRVKRNVITALIEQAKVSYAGKGEMALPYVTDDMVAHMFNLDTGLLESSTFGVFVTDSSKAHQNMETIMQLAHAAMQTQKINLSDITKVMRSEGLIDAEERLEAGEEKVRREAEEAQIRAIQEQGKVDQAKAAENMKVLEFERETKIILEDMKTKRDLQKQAILSLGFNEDKDLDKDGTPDVLEVYQEGVDAEVKVRKQALDEKKFEHQKVEDKEKRKLEEKKIAKQSASSK